MDRTGQNAGSQLPARSPSAIMVRSDSLIADAWEGGPDALPQIVRQVQESGRQPHSTFWRRVLFFWLRICKYEYKAREKSSVLDLRIPIPLPIIGALFQQRLSWSQAYRFF